MWLKNENRPDFTSQYRIEVFTHSIASKLRKSLNTIHVLHCLLIIKKLNSL